MSSGKLPVACAELDERQGAHDDKVKGTTERVPYCPLITAMHPALLCVLEST